MNCLKEGKKTLRSGIQNTPLSLNPLQGFYSLISLIGAKE